MNSLNAIHIKSSLWQEMIGHVARTYPEEGCGLVGGIGDQVTCVIPVTNQLHSPKKYLMDAQEQIHALIDLEKKHIDLLAIFHSHPTGGEAPSESDIHEFAYPGSATIIFTLKEEWHARCFLISIDGIKEIPYIIAEG